MTRARAKAVALAKRRPDPLPWLPWMLLLTLLVAALMLGQSAFGQTGPATPGGGSTLVPPGATVPGQTNTPGHTGPDTPGGTTRNGVATPSANRDPGINTGVPQRATSMPVIPPPGTPGGNPNVVPK